MSSGRVNGVAFSNGESTLVVNGQPIRLNDIVEVIQDGTAEAS
jgi:hypothetical protein